MKNKKTFLVAFISTLFILLACSLVGSPPVTATREPVPTVYATAITAGGAHACALLNTGKVKCWGANDTGQLGDGTYTPRNTPVEVPNLTNVIAVSAGGSHTCAIMKDSKVLCWGFNTSGQLGDGTKEMRPTPVPVSGLVGTTSISAGGEHTCAITKEGALKCWGKNHFGRVGSGSNTRSILEPADVVELNKGVVSVAAGGEHTCALMNTGEVKCWGANLYGQVGDDSTINRYEPVQVNNIPQNSKAIATGDNTSCAIHNSNGVSCWGWIGLQDYYLSPHPINGLEEDITAITVGGDHICALTMEGIVKCLGENEFGQLGRTATNGIYSAKTVEGLEKVESITANFNYTCVLTSKGMVFCWGDNQNGQLGNGTNTGSSEPVEVIGLFQ